MVVIKIFIFLLLILLLTSCRTPSSTSKNAVDNASILAIADPGTFLELNNYEVKVTERILDYSADSLGLLEKDSHSMDSTAIYSNVEVKYEKGDYHIYTKRVDFLSTADVIAAGEITNYKWNRTVDFQETTITVSFSVKTLLAEEDRQVVLVFHIKNEELDLISREVK